jgi:hypothetical protein
MALFEAFNAALHETEKIKTKGFSLVIAHHVNGVVLDNAKFIQNWDD